MSWVRVPPGTLQETSSKDGVFFLFCLPYHYFKWGTYHLLRHYLHFSIRFQAKNYTFQSKPPQTTERNRHKQPNGITTNNRTNSQQTTEKLPKNLDNSWLDICLFEPYSGLILRSSWYNAESLYCSGSTERISSRKVMLLS